MEMLQKVALFVMPFLFATLLHSTMIDLQQERLVSLTADGRGTLETNQVVVGRGILFFFQKFCPRLIISCTYHTQGRTATHGLGYEAHANRRLALKYMVQPILHFSVTGLWTTSTQIADDPAQI